MKKNKLYDLVYKNEVIEEELNYQEALYLKALLLLGEYNLSFKDGVIIREHRGGSQNGR